MVVVGDLMVDVVVRAGAPVDPGGDVPARIAMTLGGSAANAAHAAASTGAGVEVHLVAALGDDPAGKGAACALAAAGVRVHPQRTARPTGTVVALIDAEGQRAMLSDRGANAALTADAVPPALWTEGGHLHLSGYVLADPGTCAAGLEILARAAAAGMTRSIDPSPALGTGPAECCCANLDEGRRLTGASAPEAVAVALLRRFSEVAVTLGADGVVVAGEGRPPQRLPAPPTAVVDTTGAGDAFAGAYLAWRSAGAEPAVAAERGLAAASPAVTTVGAGWGPYSAR
jgi:ribokinase